MAFLIGWIARCNHSVKGAYVLNYLKCASISTGILPRFFLQNNLFISNKRDTKNYRKTNHYILLTNILPRFEVQIFRPKSHSNIKADQIKKIAIIFFALVHCIKFQVLFVCLKFNGLLYSTHKVEWGFTRNASVPKKSILIGHFLPWLTGTNNCMSFVWLE